MEIQQLSRRRKSFEILGEAGRSRVERALTASATREIGCNEGLLVSSVRRNAAASLDTVYHVQPPTPRSTLSFQVSIRRSTRCNT